MRLIDIEPLQKEHWHLHRYVAGVYAARVEEMELEEVPTVDAAPVKHGQWTTKRTQKHDGEWYCTVCDYEPIVMSDDMKYCPGCGAKMELEG
jgi:rubrerythrin